MIIELAVFGEHLFIHSLLCEKTHDHSVAAHMERSLADLERHNRAARTTSVL